jgi:hypothetical protein
MQSFQRTLTDALDALNEHGALYFTRRQLYYEFCRVLRHPDGLETKSAGALFAATAVTTSILTRHKPNLRTALLSAEAMFFGAMAALRSVPHTLEPPLKFGDFELRLEQFLENTQIPFLIPESAASEFPTTFPYDLKLFGMPRLLICQSLEIARFLRANQFHLQTPCGVLALAEATPLSDEFKTMLLNAETPEVFFLHDASFKGLGYISEIGRLLNIDQEIPVRPLGLRPVHAKRLKLFAVKSECGEVDFDRFAQLDNREKRWLASGQTAEVSAIQPVRLLRVLRRLILGLEIPENRIRLLPDKNSGFI